MAAPACAAVTAASIVAHRSMGEPIERADRRYPCGQLRPACVSLVASGPKTAPRVARIQRRRRVAGPRWAVASSDNSRHSRICWNPGPSCLRLMFPGAGDGCPRCRRPALQSGLWRRLPFAGGALGQAEHVFLRGNGLPERWRGRDAFTVCETGFGLGLNFWRCGGHGATTRRAARCCTCWRSKAIPSLWRIWLRCWRATRHGRWPAWRASWRPMAAAAAWLAPARI